jgi:hypothetical protein
MPRFLILAFIGLAACGAEVETVPASANESPTTEPEKKTGEADQPAPPSSPSPSPGPDPAAPPLVRLKNTSSATRWIVVDGQSTPVEFEVGNPPLQLNGYGAYWCGGPTNNHNDPFNHVAKLEAGKVAEVYWRAISVTWNGECWSGTPLSGSYPTKACFYESDPRASDGVPKKCVDVTLTISASGETILDL